MTPHYSYGDWSTQDLQQRVSDELELLQHVPIDEDDIINDGEKFPEACKSLLYSIPGNTHCIDCGLAKPEWASITFGVLMCVHCSGVHRSYGVDVSRVRSITMDHWTHGQVLAMLEGGNAQLRDFFVRHGMMLGNTPISSNTHQYHHRYETKTAKSYRKHLDGRVITVSTSGCYTGRQIKPNLGNTIQKQGPHRRDSKEERDDDLSSDGSDCSSSSTSSSNQQEQKEKTVYRSITSSGPRPNSNNRRARTGAASTSSFSAIPCIRSIALSLSTHHPMLLSSGNS